MKVTLKALRRLRKPLARMAGFEDLDLPNGKNGRWAPHAIRKPDVNASIYIHHCNARLKVASTCADIVDGIQTGAEIFVYDHDHYKWKTLVPKVSSLEELEVFCDMNANG